MAPSLFRTFLDPTKPPSAHRRRARGRTACAVAVVALGALAGGSAPRFGPDDPIGAVREMEDASGVQTLDMSLVQDWWNDIRARGDDSDREAADVNSVDEVPDSNWFENRIGTRPMSAEEIAGGPNRHPPAGAPWTVTTGKFQGVTPGLQMKDSAGQLFFIKFDPPAYPELASGAEIISTKLFYAAGYYVPENYLVAFTREDLRLAPGAVIRSSNGARHPMTDADLDALLSKAARRADGRYRAVASRALPGRPLGPFMYFGTRADDPNDTVPHEHRRELRGLRVFAAWTNHYDTKASNTLDTLVPGDDGRMVVRHQLIDFGSTLGSAGVAPADPRSGNEYILERRPILLSLATLGLYVRPWLTIRYTDIPSVGRFEGERFDPAQWRPTLPNRAMLNARLDDTFWAARRVMAFTDEAIRRTVETAEYSDPRATDSIVSTLIERRDKVGREWLTAINPLVDFAIDSTSTLTFDNTAEAAGLSTPAAGYDVQWFRFDNNGRGLEAVSPRSNGDRCRAPVPAELRGAAFIAADVSAFHPEHPAWQRPVRVFFRRVEDGWKLVGLERN
jgi:hypothetical protein